MIFTNLNPATTIALLTWPLVTLWLYKTLPVGRATIWTIMGAHMLLPVGASFKIEMIPQFDKGSIPNLAALIACMLVLGRPVRIRYGFGLVEVLLIIILTGPMITSLLNADPLYFGDLVLPGAGAYDAGSAIISEFLFLIPFFLGRQILRTNADTQEILRALVVAGLIYSLPILFEARMAPVLHQWIYGYDAGAFYQNIRDGGYRPIVFMGHGLVTAFFVMTTAVASAAFARTGTPVTRVAALPSWGVTSYLSGILILCKSFGSLLYGIAAVPLVWFTSPKLQMRISLLLVTLALTYPMLRLADLVPTTTIVGMIESVNSDRAGSLESRFKNEHELLERATQRFMFGWGRFGRSLIYDEQGNFTSAPDGRWTAVLGQYGLVGFFAEFGLLVLPVFYAFSAFRYVQLPQDKVFLATLTLIISLNVVDLIPNSTLTPLTWLFAGALLGRAEVVRAFRYGRQSSQPITRTV